MNGMTSLNYNL